MYIIRIPIYATTSTFPQTLHLNLRDWLTGYPDNKLIGHTLHHSTSLDLSHWHWCCFTGNPNNELICQNLHPFILEHFMSDISCPLSGVSQQLIVEHFIEPPQTLRHMKCVSPALNSALASWQGIPSWQGVSALRPDIVYLPPPTAPWLVDRVSR